MTSTLFLGDFLRIDDLEDGVFDLILDNRQEPVNTMSETFREELHSAVAKLQQQAPKGLLISSAKPGFLAGANIGALAALLDQPPEQQIAFCSTTAEVLCELEDLPCPSVSLINGFALGGGMELALCSDYRVAENTALLGFPEVGLGVLPGVGGTVKAPRLASFATGLEWLTSGRQYSAAKVADSGMVDEVCEGGALRERGLLLLQRAMQGQLDWQARRAVRRGPAVLDAMALTQCKTNFSRRAAHYPAAMEITHLLERCAVLDRDAALVEEAKAFSVLARSTTASALVAVFRAQQALKSKNKAYASQEKITRAGVLGAGIMGGGIAFTTAQRGTPVIMKDIARPAVDLGHNEAKKLLKKSVSTGKFTQQQADAVLDSIQGQLNYSEFNTLDIVAEAVVEKLAVKQTALAEVEHFVRPDTVLASNTSSLRIADIAQNLTRPENLTGMHFFNPVHMMPLVEVVKGPQSSDTAVAKTIAYALQMGKTPLLVKDCAGFLINRILGAYFTAFNLLVRDGADFKRIDAIMTNWGWPMGPAYLLDVAGLDTLEKAMTILAQAYPGVMAVGGKTGISELAAAGRYGQKSGAGFYKYKTDETGRPQRTDDHETYRLLAGVQSVNNDSLSDEEIEQRMMLAMVLEASRCLNEGICDSAEDLDTGMRMGTGFPAHFCGPLWFADHVGLDVILTRCEAYSHMGGLYTADQGLINLTKAKARFYR
ncbi:3-hydroxyacyl-CoA dehydrogenase NAD-binding domain-containing protein [Haliea sp. E1-2-M8]|uniref:3-hydroxyacyl-CoA dehydrogenase NAD-binding domain-containing protein n=1 Tax=Haliea sp. E1-2-M8 TaxID=3064706 RepID=UPI002715D8E6|nr:3-hydroxyacyl-CoA dehydrogenase NAD-binding domain-containing protein [Haliea sp. E1-2-M8]MDO8864217.1 3-hydroxyacyl-CoA dehydrogenase NAD-binding domain-containing protein [Haliea sp. E1-2-M8]